MSTVPTIVPLRVEDRKSQKFVAGQKTRRHQAPSPFVRNGDDALDHKSRSHSSGLRQQ